MAQVPVAMEIEDPGIDTTMATMQQMVEDLQGRMKSLNEAKLAFESVLREQQATENRYVQLRWKELLEVQGSYPLMPIWAGAMEDVSVVTGRSIDMCKVLAAQYNGPSVEQAVDFTEADGDTTPHSGERYPVRLRKRTVLYGAYS